MPVVVDVDRAAQLWYPQGNPIMGELEQDSFELSAGERTLWFGDDKGIPATVGIFQVHQDARGFWTTFPGQASAFVDVVVGGHDLAVRSDQACRDVGLPSQTVGGVLQIVG